MGRRYYWGESAGYAPILAAAILVGSLQGQAPQSNELLTVSPAASQGTGQIQGKVVADSDRSPFANTTVIAYRISPPPTVRANAATAKDGTFTIAGLTAGKYGICVNDSAGSFIDPCKWVDLATTVNVTDGKASTGTLIRMKKSSTLTVRINDPGHELDKKSGEAWPPHILVGVTDLKGVFHLAINSQKDNGGVSYTLPMPFDFPVRLYVYSAKVALEDDQHVPVPPQGLYENIVQASAQKQLKTFIFHATGRKP